MCRSADVVLALVQVVAAHCICPSMSPPSETRCTVSGCRVRPGRIAREEESATRLSSHQNKKPPFASGLFVFKLIYARTWTGGGIRGSESVPRIFFESPSTTCIVDPTILCAPNQGIFSTPPPSTGRANLWKMQEQIQGCLLKEGRCESPEKGGGGL